MQHSTSLLMFHIPDVRITGLVIKHVGETACVLVMRWVFSISWMYLTPWGNTCASNLYHGTCPNTIVLRYVSKIPL